MTSASLLPKTHRAQSETVLIQVEMNGSVAGVPQVTSPLSRSLAEIGPHTLLFDTCSKAIPRVYDNKSTTGKVVVLR